MNIAFYAPLKPPTSPTPSGDRLIGRLFMQALRAGGHDVALISTFRSYERHGNEARQKDLAARGREHAKQLCARLSTMAPQQRPQLMFTYHLYHKAPDWIGPAVAKCLSIPYVVAEASFAPKQAAGPWAAGHEEVARTLSQADLVIGLNPQDKPCVTPLLRTANRYQAYRPFIDCSLFDGPMKHAEQTRARLNVSYGLTDPDAPLLFTAAMMRKGNKLNSFLLLARALTKLPRRNWTLMIAGGGPEEAKARAAFAPFGSRIIWTGLLDGEALRDHYGAADLFVWPAIREVMGMSVLEAQAAGTAVLLGDAPGVLPLVHEGHSAMIVAENDSTAFGDGVAALLDDKERCCTMGHEGARYVRAHHGITAASAQLNTMLGALVS